MNFGRISMALSWITAASTWAAQPSTVRLLRATDRIDESHGDRAVAVVALDAGEAATFEFDGRMDEGFWQRARPMGGFVTIYEGLPAAAATEARVAHDGEHLLIGLRCEVPPGETAPRDDQVRILLSPESRGQRFAHLLLSASGRTETVPPPAVRGRASGFERRVLNPARAMEPAWEARVHREGSGWTAEVRIPFSELGGFPSGERPTWRINLVRDRFGLHPVSAWFPLRRAYMDWAFNGAFFLHEDRMGELHFGPDAGQLVPLPRDSFRFTYRSPVEKELALPFQPAPATREFRWHAPDGKTAILDVQPAGTEEDAAVFRFSHPLPQADGRHVLEIRAEPAEGGPLREMRLFFDREALVRAGGGAQRALLEERRRPTERREVPWGEPSEEARRLVDMVPRHSGFRDCPTPAIEDPERRGRFDWDPAHPDRLVCRTTGEVFPNEEKYPTAGAHRWTNPLGEVVEYRYVLTPGGERAMLEAHTWYLRRNHVVNSVEALARRDPLGAALVLLKLAEAYPGYGPTYDHRWGRPRVYETVGPPFPQSAAGIWASWPNAEELFQVVKMARALARIRETDVLDRGSAETGEDLDARIEYGLVRPSVEHIRSFALHNHNIDGSTWRGMIEIAQALGEPDYVHDVVERQRVFMGSEFFFDGFFNEITISYHRQTLRNMVRRVDDMLSGWRDPEGYVSPRSGRHTQEFNIRQDIVQAFPVVGRALDVDVPLVFPNGRILPVQDTWAYTTGAAPERSDPLLLPAARIARLGRGAGANQAQAYLLFHPKYTGHTHADALNLVFYAAGQELVPDLGYERSHIRSWSQSSLGQNMVVVDARDIDLAAARPGGNIEVFAPVSEDVQVVRAHQENAYAGITDLYAREVWLIGRPDGGEYLVDIFRVSGGARHEYTFHGEALHESHFSTDLPTTDYGPALLPPGTTFREPVDMSERGYAGGHYEPYLFIRDVRRAPLSDGRFEVTLHSREVDVRPVPDGVEVEEKGRALPGMRVTGFAGAGSELFLGRAPSLRAVRFSRATGHRRYGPNRSEMMQHWMPKLVVRREGEGLSSTFVTVMEPFQPGDEGPGTTVEWLEDLPEGVVGLSVRRGSRRDVLLSALAEPGRPWRNGDIEFSGKLGLIREDGNAADRLVLVGGTVLQSGEAAVSGMGPVSGRVIGVLRREAGDDVDGIVVDREVPPEMAGRYVVVTHPDGLTHGYRIEGVRREQDRVELVLDLDPGFEFSDDGTSGKAFFPFTRWPDQAHRFRIENVADSSRRP